MYVAAVFCAPYLFSTFFAPLGAVEGLTTPEACTMRDALDTPTSLKQVF
jgi:hypothetical protein